MLRAAAGDVVNPIHPVIPRVENRRDGPRRQRRFPSLPDSDDEDSETDAPAAEDEEPRQSPALPDEEEHKIDIHVSGRFIPTRQFLPSREAGFALH